MIATNIGELIEILKTMDPKGTVMTIEPPFDGVKVIPQANGSVLFGRPREPESKCAPVS